MKYILNNVGKRLSVSRVLFFEGKKYDKKLLMSCVCPVHDRS